MNPLVRAYLTARLRRLEEAELQRLVEDVRERQHEARPAIQRARAERRARRPQDGPQGFVMVDE